MTHAEALAHSVNRQRERAEKAEAEVERLRGTLVFVRQRVHQAHHDTPIELCPKATCDAIAQALGERVTRTA